MNPEDCGDISLNVVNQTTDALMVNTDQSGGGTDLYNVATGQPIDPGGTLGVAMFPVGSAFQNRWDWLYLTNSSTGDQYQIYIQVTNDPRSTYAYFGWRDTSSNQNSSNPSPFDPGCSLVAWNGDACTMDYILVTLPTQP